MKTIMSPKILLVWLFAMVGILGLAQVPAWADPLAETREVLFAGTELEAKAVELQTPVAIYEYVRNTHEYSLYHGSRSNSINTFLGRRGSDVDIASVLIALYRSQGIPARYAVGTVKVPAADVANWLGVHDTQLAAAIMNDQGIQNVSGPDADGYIQFAHVWVQAQLPYHNYRGTGLDAGVACDAEPEKCHWVSLDPSFKFKDYPDNPIDIYEAVPFDYDRYYSAIKNDDAEFRDKNPLEIYEEQILEYLKANHPGKTLEDVADQGTIIPVNDGLLPASLPYEIVGQVVTYDSVTEHDDVAENKDWAKYLNGKMSIVAQYAGGGTISITTGIGGPHALADLSTKRLTITYSSIDVNGEADRVEVRLGGELVATPFVSSGSLTFPIGTPFSVDLTLDGAPATQTGEEDSQIEVTYNTLIVGGYYLIGTGGDVSNWSQVHRAAEQLLAANDQYRILNDENNVPYVDQNGNGVIDSGEPPLLADPEAQDALTGGLLYVAMSQYFTKFVEGLRRLDALNHVTTPIEGFVGVVSSTFEVEYLGDGTAFSVMPGGLLIDMKGQRVSGAWRTDVQEGMANSHFEMVGHVCSSLEHEIWQELTGYDAVSTVRGIQMALADGTVSLLRPEDSGSANNMTGLYDDFGFEASAPAGFTYAPFDDIFGTRPATWTHSSSGAKMDLMKRNVDTATSSTAKLVGTYYYSLSSGLYAWCDCIDTNENQLRTWISQGYGNYNLGTQTVCNGTFSGTVNQYLSQLQSHWFNTVIPNYFGQTYFDYFNRNNGFNPNDYVYRFSPAPTNMHDGVLVATIRNSVMIGTEDGRWEYVIPARRTEGDLYRFTVDLEKIYDRNTGDLASQSYSIHNDSFTAGGGWVDGSETLTLAGSLPGTSLIAPTFNNEVFTDQNLVAQTNNDLIRTPSTADPVSTVTGNMYHDETDLTIKSRGIDYVFTRSYNSGPARSKEDGPLGFGWTHSYNMSLRSNDYGDCPNCASGSGAGQAPENGNNVTASITYVDERGGEHTYLVDEATLAVTAPPGEFDQLQLDTQPGQHTLTFRNGVRYVFEGPTDLKTVPERTARLAYIEDPRGNRLTMSYDGSGRLAGVADNLGISGRTGLTFAYNGSDTRIQSVSDWSGRSWSFGYDTDGNLTSVTNPLSKTTTYTYVGDGSSHLLKDLILPEDRDGQQVTTTFAYYQNHKAFNYANKKGETETLDYDLYRQRTRVTDPRGFVREYQYDPDNGALTKLVEPDGAILRFANNADGLRYQKSDALNYTTTYSYRNDRTLTGSASDTGGNVTKERDPLNYEVEYDYGLFDQITRVKDKNGNERFYTYYPATVSGSGEVRGKLEKVEAMLGGQRVTLESYTYYDNGNLKQKIEYIDQTDPARRRITDYTWDATGLNVMQTVTSGATSGGSVTVSYTYDSLGRKKTETLQRQTSATDPTLLSLTTSYVYDALGRVIRVTDPLGNIRETIFDANSKVYQQKVHYKKPDATFDTRTYVSRTYDAADRLVSETDIYGHTTSYKYDAGGNLIQTTDANGHVTRYAYDAMGHQTAIIDANGHRIETVYDLAGRPVKSIDANGHALRFEYDALGRKTRDITPMGFETLYEYDPNGNLEKMTDANAVAGLQPKNSHDATIYNEYDAFNRLVRSVDALDGETRFTYDLLGNVTSLTDAEQHTTAFVYDDLGRLVEVIGPIHETPEDKTETFTYDETGNVLTKTDREGRVTRYTYDDLNRLRLTEYLADATSETYDYGLYGGLVAVGNEAVTYSYGYDLKHRLISKTDGRLSRKLSWEYDPVGNISRKTDYQNEVTEYQYDSTNRLVAERNRAYLQVSYHYDPAGRLLNRILSNRAQTDYEYDADNRLTRLTNTSAGDKLSLSQTYAHDRVGNIISITDDSGETTYAYDALYRLTGADAPGTANDRLYVYDKVGNRTSDTYGGDSIWHYLFNNPGNRLDEVRDGSPTGDLVYRYVYDDNGNRIEKRNGSDAVMQSYSYDQKNRITAVSSAPGATLSFQYDSNDYRITKDNGSALRKYLLEGEHYEAVYDGANQIKAKFLRGVVVDEIVNGYYYDEQGKGTNHTFHHDHLQSVTALSGHNGDQEQTYQFDPFGAVLSKAGQTLNDLMYTGRQYDAETGLYYYRARYYDPEIGRFLGEDPLGFEAGVNFYAYVQNNPINYNDPDGFDPRTAALRLGSKLIQKIGGRMPRNWRLGVLNKVHPKTGIPFKPTGFPDFSGVAKTAAKITQTGVRHVDEAAANAAAGFTGGTPAGYVWHHVEDGVTMHLVPAIIHAATGHTGGVAVKATTTGLVLVGGVMIAPEAEAEETETDWGEFLTDLFWDFLIPGGVGEVSTDSYLPPGTFDQFSGAAGGGFVLYPNKPNTNMMRAVYSK